MSKSLLLVSFILGLSIPKIQPAGRVEEVPKDLFDYNFKIKDLSGKVVDFNEFKGKVIFLNLWATWCKPCRNEMPTIQQLYETTDTNKVAFVMLSLDKDFFQDKVKSYIEKSGFSFPVYMSSGSLPDQLQVPSIPTSFIIDKNGYIVVKEVGMKNYNTPKFRRLLKDLAEK